MKILPPKVKTFLEILKARGLAGILNRFRELVRRRRAESDYRRWIARHRLTPQDRQNINDKIANFPRRPLLSVILPVYNVEEKWLRSCLDSVLRQLYENWELCIADDRSPAPHVRRILEEYAAGDKRIKVVFRSANGHISAASNSALELATGEFCVLLDHDDELTEDALFYLANELNDFPETTFMYSDEDMIDERGRRFYPKFKPDFSRDLFYSLNLITHLSAYRTDILRKIGGFRAGLEGSQDYDLALRFIEQTGEQQIRHIPRILYHWRAIEGSVALSSDEKPYAHERARAALREHFERTGKKATVTRGLAQFHRVRYELPENPPKVSLVLSADNDSGNLAFDFAPTVIRFLDETAYPNIETILVCPGSPRNLYFSGDVRVIFRENLSKAESLNQAVSESTGEILCFADLNLLPLSEDWLAELVSFAIQPEIGAVGGKVLAKNETVAAGPLVVGFDGLTGTAFRGLPNDADGNLFRARVVNNFSAVSASCLAVRRAFFEEIGGFDAVNLPDALFDADLCLRLGEQNLRIVFTPYAGLIEIEKSSRPAKPGAAEKRYFGQKWRGAIERDPFFNPNLSLTGETFTIEI
jgi:glycosyltransferase involved in cell wall biosynthesis